MAKQRVSQVAEKKPPKLRPAPPARPGAVPSANGSHRPKAGSPEVRVRMYRHGLGDCFLLSFPRKATKPGEPTTPFHILIDCGIIPGTTAADKKLDQVVRDIREVTGGVLDVLVVTHEHADHISGFNPNRNRFEGFTIKRVWLAWTEDPKDKLALSLRAERRQKLAALWLGFHQLERKLKALGLDPVEDDTLGRASEILSFFGIDSTDEGVKPAELEGLGAAADVLARGEIAKPKKSSKPTKHPKEPEGPRPVGTAGAMNWVREGLKAERTFWKPGEVATLGEVEGEVKVYVLGPPLDIDQLHKDLPSTSKGKVVETYPEDQPEGRAAPARAPSRAMDPETFGAAERAFFAGAFRIEPDPKDGPRARGDDERDEAIQREFGSALPFDKKYQIGWKDAEGLEFFQDRYFGRGESCDWRRIDSEWADGGASFALKLDGDTNNTSLALAFELPGGHVLLFPGDAQVGNWESWHADSGGRPLVFKDKEKGTVLKVTAESLLNRVVLYKVGHHGSHNATLRDKGLEMMTRPDLSAMVPVDAYVAHVKKKWSKMPFNPLMDRLKQKITKGVVILADMPIPARLDIDGLAARIEDSKDPFVDVEFEVEGPEKTAKRPLFVDYVLNLGTPGA